MRNGFSFSTFSELINDKGQGSVEEQIGQNYVLMVIQNQLCTEDINFSKFEFEDLIEVYEGLDSVLSDEDTEGRICIDPNHPYTRIMALSNKIYSLGKLPKQRPPSPFLFL
ncbi:MULTISPECIES: hypothetical protein [Bacillota]|uniref:hypothetical protein n=1 Tax=Bacillota TaxID=1239 RepID=UPI0039EFFE9B